MGNITLMSFQDLTLVFSGSLSFILLSFNTRPTDILQTISDITIVTLILFN
jgi:hypothetical protein